MNDVLNENQLRSIGRHFDLTKGEEPPLSLWIIGRPAAGKTTAAIMLRDVLIRTGHRVELVDGENVRSIYNGDYGFSVADRLAHLKNLIHLNQVLQERDIIPITATIGGLHTFRDMVRKNLKNPRLIYLDCPFEVAAERDNKGNYAKALAGKLKDFFGIDIPFQPPVECEMRINSASLKPSEITSSIMEHLYQTALLRRI